MDVYDEVVVVEGVVVVVDRVVVVVDGVVDGIELLVIAGAVVVDEVVAECCPVVV